MDEVGIKFLDKLYGNLYMSDVVQHTRENTDSRVDAIRKYLERLEKLHSFATTEERKELILNLYFDKYVVKEENIPWGQDKEQVIDAQKKKLAMWISYLTDPTTSYPTWAKYWAFQGMLKMGSYDEIKGSYTKRTKDTIAPFVDPNPEIIAKSINTIMKLVNNEEPDEIIEERLTKTDSFSKIYTIFEKKFKKNSQEKTNNKDGIWIKYNQGSKDDAIRLSKSLENKNTGWCTANESTAISQVCGYDDNNYGDYYFYDKGGDFYVYYSKDKEDKYTIPRIAIRCDGHDKISEIRGTEEGQNLEEEMISVLEIKLKDMDFLDKESINDSLEKVKRLAELSEILKKTKNNIDLSTQELTDLYFRQYGFGWTQDPRVKKIIKARNIVDDYNMLPIETKEALLCARRLPRTFKIDDEEMLKRTIEKNPMSFVYASERLCDKKDFIMFILSISGGIYSLSDIELISKRLRDDEDVVKLIIKNTPNGFMYASDRLKDNEEIVRFAILGGNEKQAKPLISDGKTRLGAIYGETFIYASDRLRDNKKFVLNMIEEYNVPLIQYTSERLRDDKDVVIETVEKDSEQLKFASDKLRDDKEVVKAALKNTQIRSLGYASSRLRDDKDFILDLLKNENMDPLNILDASSRIKDNEEVAMSALSNASTTRRLTSIYENLSDRLKQKSEIRFMYTARKEAIRKKDELHSFQSIYSSLTELGKDRKV